MKYFFLQSASSELGKCYLILSQSILTPKQHSDTYFISTEYNAHSTSILCLKGTVKLSWKTKVSLKGSRTPIHLCAVSYIDNDYLRCEAKERYFQRRSYAKVPLKVTQCLKDLQLVQFSHGNPTCHVSCIISDGEQSELCLIEMIPWTTGYSKCVMCMSCSGIVFYTGNENGQKCKVTLTLTFDRQHLISLSLSPSRVLCQI